MEVEGLEVRIERSERRQKTISLGKSNGHYVVRAPASMTDATLRPIVARLIKQLRRRQANQVSDESSLQGRAEELNRQYFANNLRWQRISWVGNQEHRWGSCTPATGMIRISDRVQRLPPWVQDYVLIHELAHLIEANHGSRFWALVNRYPRTERARGYLMALGGDEEEQDM